MGADAGRLTALGDCPSDGTPMRRLLFIALNVFGGCVCDRPRFVEASDDPTDDARAYRGGDQMRRREFVAVLGGAALARPSIGRAQQLHRSARVGILAGGSPPKDFPPWAEFEQGFRELGYIQAQNLILEGRFAGGDLERLPTLAAELVAMKVDVIVVLGPAPMRAAQVAAAASDIPIVMFAGSSDPIGEGFIGSFAGREEILRG